MAHSPNGVSRVLRSGRFSSIGLEALEVSGQVGHTGVDHGFLAVLLAEEEGAPYGHFPDAVGLDVHLATDDLGDALGREDTLVLPVEGGQVGDGRLQVLRDGSAAEALGAMAAGTVGL